MENLQDLLGKVESSPFLLNFTMTSLSLLSLLLLKKSGQGIKKGVKWLFTPAPVTPPSPASPLLQVFLKDLDGPCTLTIGRDEKKVRTKMFDFIPSGDSLRRSCVLLREDTTAGVVITQGRDLENMLPEQEQYTLRQVLDKKIQEISYQSGQNILQNLLTLQDGGQGKLVFWLDGTTILETMNEHHSH